MRKYFRYIWVAPLLLILAVVVYYIPPVHDRLAWRIDEARTRMKYFSIRPIKLSFNPAAGQTSPLKPSSRRRAPNTG